MQNSMIAKLLAKENISVEHGAYRTAFFNVESRVLGLPLWKDMGKDVYDLLVGHEVGHALYTPADGWHNSKVTIPGVPRAYINVVEDIRIEKLIQRTYPGLVGCFKRGYNVLNNQDFFGIKDKDVNSMFIGDRINLKAKLRDLIDVPFYDNERAVVNQCFAVETWEDVIEACRALYEFVEDNQNEQEQYQNYSDEVSDESESMDDQVQSSNISGKTDGEDASEDKTSNVQQSGADGDDSENQQSGEEDSDQSSNSGSDEVDELLESIKEELQSAGQPSAGHDGSNHAVETDRNFRDREDDLLDVDRHGRMKDVVKAITRKQADNMVIGYKQVFDIRDASMKEYKSYYGEVNLKASTEKLEVFKAETKRFVSLMAKEFEMRKMAYRYNRSSTSRSGSLNMNKLHNYRFTDDIFNRVTQLADAKSHGMIMFIDWSGSMSNVIHDVAKQTLILAEFCKKVNIPFDVYSFTSGRATPELKAMEGEIDIDRTQIVQHLSSTMSKAEYNRAFYETFMISDNMVYRSYPVSDADSFGGTPLNETIMASRFIIRDFKAKYGIQKTNVVYLTDGDAQRMYVNRNLSDMDTYGTLINYEGQMIDGGIYMNLTDKLLNQLRKEATVIGYFIADTSYNFRGKMWQAEGSFVTEERTKEVRKLYNKQKFVQYDNVLGYDKFFILKGEGRSLDTTDDEFVVSENAKKGEILRAFKKHANSKKANKVLATQFAKMVA